MKPAQPTALDEFMARYGLRAGADGPVLMVREIFGAEPDPWQEDALRAYGAGTKRISIRSCHRVGKGALDSWIAWHQLLCKYPQKTLATAPSSPQLFDSFFAEFVTWGMRLKPAVRGLYDIKSDRVELKCAPEASFLTLRTARAETPESMQGLHSPNTMLIVDEASGVPEPVYQSILGSLAGKHAQIVLTSNPVRTSGYFFETHHRNKARWHTIHVSYEMSPRVDRDYVEDIAATYGRDSNVFRIRCLGEFPTSDLDKIIPWELIEAAQKRPVEMRPEYKEVWGVDVARFGDDLTALVRRNKLGVSPLLETWQGRDLMQSAGRIKAIWDELEERRRPDEILIDDIGLGGGVVDRLLEQGLPVRGVNVSELPATNPRYRDLRSELWFKGRDWLASRDKSLPARCICERCQREPTKDHAAALANELALVGFDYTSGGKIIAEPKAAIKRGGHDSPNLADAFLLSLAGEPAMLLHGLDAKNAWTSNWNEPVRRKMAVV
jgi:hypothetical protein